MDFVLRVYPVTINNVVDIKTGTIFGQLMSFAAPGEDTNKNLFFFCFEPLIPQGLALEPQESDEKPE